MSGVRKVCFVSISAWNLVNFRRDLIIQLIRDGVEVFATSAPDEHVEQLRALGVTWEPLPIDPKGTNPLADIGLVWRLSRTFRRWRPDCALLFTVKPVIYGSIAARLVGVPSIVTITGLGAAFINENWITKVIRNLYRVALRWPSRVLFQNADDLSYFVANRLVRRDQTALVAGSGIDLQHYPVAPFPDRRDGIVFLYVGRMLWDKGLAEYVAAARLLRPGLGNARFAMLGQIGVANPAAIDRSTIDRWVAEEGVEYWGSTDDVRPFLARAHCIVLPSYREGLPRSLLEGAAMGRPLVATDAVGCRDVVSDGVNGFSCAVRDPDGLASALRRIADLDAGAFIAMGRASRAKVAGEFSKERVIATYRDAIGAVVGDRSAVVEAG